MGEWGKSIVGIPTDDVGYRVYPAQSTNETIELVAQSYPALSGITYEWYHYGPVPPGSGNGYRLYVERPMYYPVKFYVECRAKRNGVYSEWGKVWVYVDGSTVVYSQQQNASTINVPTIKVKVFDENGEEVLYNNNFDD
jgi:hypothetical protein